MAKFKFNPLGAYLFDYSPNSSTSSGGGNSTSGGNDNTQHIAPSSVIDYLHDASYNSDSKELIITQDSFFASNDYLNDANYIAESKTLTITALLWKN